MAVRLLLALSACLLLVIAGIAAVLPGHASGLKDLADGGFSRTRPGQVAPAPAAYTASPVVPFVSTPGMRPTRLPLVPPPSLLSTPVPWPSWAIGTGYPQTGPTPVPIPPASPTMALAATAVPAAPEPASGDARPAVAPVPAYLPPPEYQVPELWVDEDLQAQVLDYLGPAAGAYGVMAKRLCDGRGVDINTDSVFYAASLFKLEVMYSVFKRRAEGVLDLDDMLVVTPFHASYDLDTLPFAVGSAVSVRDLLEAMITISDNTSAIILYDRVGWRDVDDDMREIGLTHSAVWDEALPTTAHDMFVLMELIARGEAVDRESSEEMIGLLSRQRLNSRMPALLPEGTLVGHKTGEWSDATHDVGIVFAPQGTYVLAMLSAYPWDTGREAELSALIYGYFDGTPCLQTHAELTW